MNHGNRSQHETLVNEASRPRCQRVTAIPPNSGANGVVVIESALRATIAPRRLKSTEPRDSSGSNAKPDSLNLRMRPRALLMLLAPSVPGHARWLVHIQGLDHEQHH